MEFAEKVSAKDTALGIEITAIVPSGLKRGGMVIEVKLLDLFFTGYQKSSEEFGKILALLMQEFLLSRRLVCMKFSRSFPNIVHLDLHTS